MSHNFYAEIHLHITWHTKNSLPLLAGEVEKVAHDAIRRKAISFPGVIVHALDGVENHVHIAISIPPTLRISDFIGQVKGYSSHAINEVFRGTERFEWQAGYGVLSFGTGNLSWVVHYILNQKSHHAQHKTFDRLERVAIEDGGDEPVPA
jgi:putative transposase